ncbi:MAG: thioredoxin [Holosporales bacterium]|jgi:thioredoxin 1|nr:thioredoxin [Holosporales bacterium]
MQQIQESDFEARVLKSGTPVVVDFAAEWCPPCRSMIPLLNELSAELAGRVEFVKINIDESPAVADKYGVLSIPTLVLFSNGAKVSALVGGHSKAKVFEWINLEIKT